jgi:hypothetical protein
MPAVAARTIKLAITLEPADVLQIPVIDGQPRVQLQIAYNGHVLQADLAAKSVRQAQATIPEAGVDYVFTGLQGKLGRGFEVAEAGIIAQLKAPPKT